MAFCNSSLNRSGSTDSANSRMMSHSWIAYFVGSLRIPPECVNQASVQVDVSTKLVSGLGYRRSSKQQRLGCHAWRIFHDLDGQIESRSPAQNLCSSAANMDGLPLQTAQNGRISSRTGSKSIRRFCIYEILPRCEACAERCPISTSPLGRLRERTHSRKLPTWSWSRLLNAFTVTVCAPRPTGMNWNCPRSIHKRPSLPHISTAAPAIPGTSVASNVAVNSAGYSSSTLMVSGAVRPSLYL